MTRPEVILWPDPERQWEPVIPILQERLPALLTLGAFQPAKRTGPVIWIKCMVARELPESAAWPAETTPIIYLPGFSKNDVKNFAHGGIGLQPLMEYLYTGALFTQVNGREWTVMALLENQQIGLGLKVAQDNPTKEAVLKALSVLFQDADIQYPVTLVDAHFLHGLLFPNVVHSILKWLCQGDSFMQSLSKEQAEVFAGICRARFGFEPDVKNVRAIAEMLGAQRNNWNQVWQHYANAPHKYPEVADLLRLAKPADLGSGMFAYPEESWPQVNESEETALRAGLEQVAAAQPQDGLKMLVELAQQHRRRRKWVWAELGQAPLAAALLHLIDMAEVATEAFPAADLEAIQAYYMGRGYQADQAMRRALAAVRSEKDKKAVTGVIRTIYQPWLAQLTLKFQALVAKDATPFGGKPATGDDQEFVLFVDALRYELGMEFLDRLGNAGYKVCISAGWSALPSLTPTAKPAVSPLAGVVSESSACNEFRPQLQHGKDLHTAAFRNALAEQGVVFLGGAADIQAGRRHWQEIGDIDTKGHDEQAGMVRRIDELFDQLMETVSAAFEHGIQRIQIVTDHGWLLLPGGLPKQELNKDLTETRWGRCALIKEGAKTDLLHLPWRWNPNIYIAYAQGISFFKKNEEYAHGGISLQECLTPTLVVCNSRGSKHTAPKIAEVKWVNLNCRIETTDAPDGFHVDIRTKNNEDASSIVVSKNKPLQDNKTSLMVDDRAEGASAMVVLLDANGIILDTKATLVGG
jgi:hypothetical protein